MGVYFNLEGEFTMNVDSFLEECRLAAEKIEGVSGALVFFHDDADGICSGSIISRTLEKNGFKVERICLEKFFPEVIEEVYRRERGKVVFFTDLGSPHANMLCKLNRKELLTIILDHHDPVKSDCKYVFNLNPEFHGFKGETDASGATATYLFSKTLNSSNVDLSYLAIVGSMELPQFNIGMNKIPLRDALENEIVHRKRVRGKEKLVKSFDGEETELERLYRDLNVLGSVGYYLDGPEKGVQLSLNGYSEENRRLLLELQEKRRDMFREVIGEIRGSGLKKTRHLQWFHVRDRLKGMGSKVIGSLSSYLSYQRTLVDRDKYIVGFMNLEKEVPGFGRLKKQYVKVSMRVPAQLKEKIKEGSMPPASELVSNACLIAGGLGEGHEFASSGFLLKGKETVFIDAVERIIEKNKGASGGRQKTLLDFT